MRMNALSILEMEGIAMYHFGATICIDIDVILILVSKNVF